MTFFTRGCLHSASLRDGVFSRLVVSTLKTPFGKPASVARCARARTDRGVSGLGLTIIVQPAESAAPAFRRIMLMIEFQHQRTKQIRRHLRHREVPRHKRNRNTNRLLDRKYSPTRLSRGLDSSCDPFRFASEPPCEPKSVIQFSLTFSKWFSRLIRYDIGDIIPVLPDQRIPLQ